MGLEESLKKRVAPVSDLDRACLDRLEDARLIEGHWERQEPSDNGPRRRYYRLTGTGVATASKLIAERRGQRSRPRTQAPKHRLATNCGWAR